MHRKSQVLQYDTVLLSHEEETGESTLRELLGETTPQRFEDEQEWQLYGNY